MNMAQPNRRGDWIEERMLGSGGFGAVHLWKNKVLVVFIAFFCKRHEVKKLFFKFQEYFYKQTE